MAVGIIVLWLNPAESYELSVYTATPPLFWGCLAVAMLLSLVLSLASRNPAVKWPALLLGSIGMITVSALPILRGYVFYGLADSMTHWGWATQIQQGLKSPFEFIYPASHLTAVVFQAMTGKALGWSMMLVVLLAAVTYFVFVPLAVRAIVPTSTAVVIAAFSAFLLLPLNNVATHQMFHPFSLTTLFVPVMLYLVFKHVGGAADDDTLPRSMAATSFLMAIVGIALLFYHPQTTLDLLIVLATAAGVQVLIRTVWPESRLASHRAIYGQVLLLSLFFAAWIFQFWQTWAMIGGIVESFLATIAGTADVGQSVTEQQKSRNSVGVSLAEMFIKLFLVSAIYCALAGGLVVAKLFRWIEGTPERDIAIAYFAASGATLTPFFLLQFVGDISGYFFRHVGFAMVLVTILGAAAIASIYEWSSGPGSIGLVVKPILSVVLVFALVLSTAVAFASPFIFLPGHNLSEQSYTGFQSSLEYEANANETTRWASISAETERYDEAIDQRNGLTISGDIPPNKTGNLVAFYSGNNGVRSGDHKFPVTQRIVLQEAQVYNGKDFTYADFRDIQSQEGVHRVTSNEDVSIYYVETRFNESHV